MTEATSEYPPDPRRLGERTLSRALWQLAIDCRACDQPLTWAKLAAAAAAQRVTHHPPHQAGWESRNRLTQDIAEVVTAYIHRSGGPYPDIDWLEIAGDLGERGWWGYVTTRDPATRRREASAARQRRAAKRAERQREAQAS